MPKKKIKSDEGRGQGKLFYLCLALVLLLLLHPFFDKNPYEELILDIFLTIILITILYGGILGKGFSNFSLILGIIWVLLEWLSYFFHNLFDLPATMIGLVFYFICIYTLMRHILKKNAVTKDEIFGGIAVYLLLGIFFCSVYTLVYILDTNSFKTNSPIEKITPADWSDFMYFSYNELTTLGSNDIIPSTTTAKSLVSVESLAGVLYSAILIARLIGMHNNRY